MSASAVSGLDLRHVLGRAFGLLLLCAGVLTAGCGKSESAGPAGDGAPPSPSAEAVLARLGDSSPEVRAIAARAAESLHDSAAVGIALANLTKSDPEPRVRLRALESSREFAAPEVDEALAKALADPDRRIRIAAARVLARRGAVPAVPELAKILEADPDWECRIAAAAALQAAGVPESWAPLEAAAQDPNEYVRAAVATAADELRRAAVQRPSPSPSPSPSPAPSVKKPSSASPKMPPPTAPKASPAPPPTESPSPTPSESPSPKP